MQNIVGLCKEIKFWGYFSDEIFTRSSTQLVLAKDKVVQKGEREAFVQCNKKARYIDFWQVFDCGYKYILK